MNFDAKYYFLEALELARGQFIVDAIEKFKTLIEEYPKSDLADDALYNIGYCYFEINQFQSAINNLELLVREYPDATITELENSNEFGKTAAKAYYLIVQCKIALGKIDEAEACLALLKKYNDTYIIIDTKKYTFFELAKTAINKYRDISDYE